MCKFSTGRFASAYLLYDHHSLSCPLSDFMTGKMSSNDELSASTSSSSDDESVESMGEAEGSFNSIVQPYQTSLLPTCKKETRSGKKKRTLKP